MNVLGTIRHARLLNNLSLSLKIHGQIYSERYFSLSFIIARVSCNAFQKTALKIYHNESVNNTV